MKRTWKLPVITLALLLSACAAQPTNDGDSAARGVASGHSAAEINVRLGVAYMEDGRNDVAMEKLRRALQQNPDLPSAHNAIAILLARLGEDAAADQHFQRALELNPGDPGAHNNYGLFLCQSRKFEIADKHFRAAANDPLYNLPQQAYTNAGLCAGRIPDTAKAEQYFREALQRDPLFGPALYQMAQLSVEKKEWLQARAYLQRLHAVIQPTAQSLWLGIETERALADADAANAYAKRLQASFPNSEEAARLKGTEQDVGKPGT